MSAGGEAMGMDAEAAGDKGAMGMVFRTIIDYPLSHEEGHAPHRHWHLQMMSDEKVAPAHMTSLSASRDPLIH